MSQFLITLRHFTYLSSNHCADELENFCSSCIAYIIKAVYEVIADGLKKGVMGNKTVMSVIVFNLHKSSKGMSSLSKLHDDMMIYIFYCEHSKNFKYLPYTNMVGGGSSLRTRSFHIELRYKADKEWVFRNAKELMCTSCQLNIRIAKYLKADDSAKIKLLHK